METIPSYPRLAFSRPGAPVGSQLARHCSRKNEQTLVPVPRITSFRYPFPCNLSDPSPLMRKCEPRNSRNSRLSRKDTDRGVGSFKFSVSSFNSCGSWCQPLPPVASLSHRRAGCPRSRTIRGANLFHLKLETENLKLNFNPSTPAFPTPRFGTLARHDRRHGHRTRRPGACAPARHGG